VYLITHNLGMLLNRGHKITLLYVMMMILLSFVVKTILPFNRRDSLFLYQLFPSYTVEELMLTRIVYYVLLYLLLLG